MRKGAASIYGPVPDDRRWRPKLDWKPHSSSVTQRSVRGVDVHQALHHRELAWSSRMLVRPPRDIGGQKPRPQLEVHSKPPLDHQPLMPASCSRTSLLIVRTPSDSMPRTPAGQ